MTQCTLHFTGGRESSRTWGRKNEEYIADFLLMAQRALEPEEHKVFRFHFLLGADWRLCCARMKMEKGDFFHMLYRVEARLGRAFRETEPYGLFPIDEYFHGVMRDARAIPSEPKRENILYPPLEKAA